MRTRNRMRASMVARGAKSVSLAGERQ
jgi:hypothetical protein